MCYDLIVRIVRSIYGLIYIYHFWFMRKYHYWSNSHYGHHGSTVGRKIWCWHSYTNCFFERIHHYAFRNFSLRFVFFMFQNERYVTDIYHNLKAIYTRNIAAAQMHPLCSFQGFLLDFISLPVITGFTSAAAINIASSQFKSLLGISGRTESFLDSLKAIFKNLDQIRYQDTLLGIGTIVILVLLKVYISLGIYFTCAKA